MRILLTTLNSKYIHSNLALKYLYCVAAGSDLDVSMREFTINNEKDYIYTEIIRGGYDYVCFSCYIWNITQINELCASLKKASPEMKIILGGPEVSYETKEYMKEHPWAEAVIRGEGEYAFFRLCRDLSLGDGFDDVPGLTWRKDGGIAENPEGPLLKMDQLPFPYETLEIEDDKVIYYESSRGCPYRCSYCLSSLDKSIRTLSLQRTRRDLGYFLMKGVRQVKFIDRTFNFNMSRAYDIWQYLIDNDNGVTNFHFEICADLLDDHLIALLSKARAGLFQLEIGIQSTCEKSLAACDRNTDTDVVLSNVRKLVALGNMHIHVDLIAGLPYEDYRTFAKSFNDVRRLHADNMQLGFLKLLKGTKARSCAEEYGYVYRDEAPYEIISNNFMSPTDIIKLKMIETVLELYSNKGGFERSLSYLEAELAETPFNFYEQLADFFYSNGFQHKSHKKEDLYRILLAFAEMRSYSVAVAEQARKLLAEDLTDTMNFDAVKKFKAKGWEI